MASIFLSDFSIFLGRFHPMLVHLPVGILLLAGLLEWLSRNKRLARLGEAVPAILFLGLLAALAAVASGFLLADTGFYAPEPLEVHRNAGIALTLVAAAAWLFSIGRINVPRAVYAFFILLTVFLVALTGHLGSVLTHGPDYLLAYAPAFLAGQVEGEETVGSNPSLSHPDSALVFAEILQPVLRRKCVACHGKEEKRGGLDLSDPETIRAGGDNGDVIVSGDPASSELFHRIALPPGHEKFMPPNGEHLSYTESRMLAWWIESGADFEARLAELEKPDDIRVLLQTFFGWSQRRPSYLESAQTRPLDSLDHRRLQQMGFEVERLAQNSYFLSVKPSTVLDSLGAEEWEALESASAQITWLDLGGLKLDKSRLDLLSELDQLTRLSLDDTKVDDHLMPNIRDLPHLESLNLVGTGVSDASLPHLRAMKSLQRVYIRNTRISEAGRENLLQARPDLEVISTFRFADQSDPDDQ